mmetsp:Transcript_7109/g.15168  ORF Transcript_7109/g.15168 Transcript_7109/m.15168 type:complete len:227 (-) Transcript_7109:863-1543(-)
MVQGHGRRIQSPTNQCQHVLVPLLLHRHGVPGRPAQIFLGRPSLLCHVQRRKGRPAVRRAIEQDSHHRNCLRGGHEDPRNQGNENIQLLRKLFYPRNRFNGASQRQSRFGLWVRSCPRRRKPSQQLRYHPVCPVVHERPRTAPHSGHDPGIPNHHPHLGAGQRGGCVRDLQSTGKTSHRRRAQDYTGQCPHAIATNMRGFASLRKGRRCPDGIRLRRPASTPIERE